MIITVDDLCLEYLENFSLFDQIKNEFPDFKIIAFTISNFKNKEQLKYNNVFKNWFDIHKDWVEIAIHSYDHEHPPDGDRNDEEKWIKLARDKLKKYLPKEYGYRSPGWQTTNKTTKILEKLGFSYIAYETSIKNLKTKTSVGNIVNSHLYDVNSIKRVHEILKNTHR